MEGMEKWHAAKPKSILNGVPTRPAPARSRFPAPAVLAGEGAGRDAARAPARAPAPQYTQVFGDALVRECERDPRVVGITAAMNSGTGLNILQKALPERYFDVGDRRAAGDPIRGGPRPTGTQAGGGDLLDVSCSARTTRSSTICVCRSSTWCSRWTARPCRRRRADAPRGVRHRLSAPPAQHRADGALRRGDARAHAAHRAAPRWGP